MPYLRTLNDDIERAKEILKMGRDEVAKIEGLRGPLIIRLSGATIHGADVYAAYRLLESFVEAIEAVGVDVVKTTMRARVAASHEPGCDLYAGGSQCSCSPYKEP